MDIKAAYLNGDLEEEIYMHQAKGLIQPGNKNKVYWLHKVLYGLKQAGCSWYQRIDAYLKSISFTWMQADSCIYYK